MNEEKSISEERAQPDESMKAENVSSTEAGPQANDTSINEEEKKNDNTDGKNKDEAQKKVKARTEAIICRASHTAPFMMCFNLLAGFRRKIRPA